MFELAQGARSMIIKFHHKWFDIMKKHRHHGRPAFQTFIDKTLNSKYNWWRKFNKDIFQHSEEKDQFLALMSIEERYRMSLYDGREWSLKFFGTCGGIYAVEKIEYTTDQVFMSFQRVVDMLGLTMQMFNYFDFEHFTYIFGPVL